MKALRQLIAEYDLPRRARACYQCGVCAAGCPVGRWRPEFNPRRIVEMIVRDELEALISSHTIWLCTSCFSCLDRCPQKIGVTELITQLKNAGARIGNVPQTEIKKGRQLMRDGWCALPVSRTLKQRQTLNLPELDEDLETSELQGLMNVLKRPGLLNPEGPPTKTGRKDED